MGQQQQPQPQGGERGSGASATAQGNEQARAANVRLSDEQRRRIRETVIAASGAPKVGSVDFDLRVGTVVPHDRVRVVPVPEELVRIEPTWRGLLYFVFRDEVVIVDPRDMRIVAVVPA